MEDQQQPTAQDFESALAQPDPVMEGLTPEEAAVAAKILPRIAAKANTMAEAKKAKELKERMDALISENSKLMERKIEEFRKQLTPPTQDEIHAMLEQEYAEFRLKAGRGTESKEFVLQELPMAVEAKVVKAIQKTLVDNLTLLQRVKWDTGDKSLADKVANLVEMVPGAMETLANITAMCLGGDVTGQWVMDNVSLTRMAAILQAQWSVGRYRDFLSLVSRFSGFQMTT